MSTRIARADAVAVAEALTYDPSCPKCCDEPDENRQPFANHSDDCAIAARDRILASVEEEP